MQDDEPLVRACQSGDVTSFETLVHKYQDRTVRVLYLLLGNVDDAQDVAQETFIRAFRCIRSFRGTSSFATWLHRIAINTARNWIRSSRREKEMFVLPDERYFGNEGRPDEMLLARERTLAITQALSKLPVHYREVIILRHYDELSYEEIAEVLQTPIGTVKSRLAKARMLLQHSLGHGQEALDHERMMDNGLQKGKDTNSIRGG